MLMVSILGVLPIQLTLVLHRAGSFFM
jgi:hypothetical protein